MHTSRLDLLATGLHCA